MNLVNVHLYYSTTILLYYYTPRPRNFFIIFTNDVLSCKDDLHYRHPLKHVAFFIRNIRHVGAVAPSSRFLTSRMVVPLREYVETPGSSPVRVLEVGPGTGAITQYIRPLLRPSDHVDVIELNPKLHEYVSSRYTHESMHFHNLNLLDFEIAEPYDFIFSGVPYEALATEVTHLLWRKKLDASRIGTIITYFKYIHWVNFRSTFERQVVDSCCEKVSYEFRNLPPARFFRLRVTDEVQKMVE